MEHTQALTVISQDMRSCLAEKMIPFWLERSIDQQFGGFITSFDTHGCFDGNGIKNIVTQSRMIWGFSYLLPYAKAEDRARMKAAAQQGVAFLMDHFYDTKHGGFYWQVQRDGSVMDAAKLTYGLGFAVYALSEYAKAYEDQTVLKVACETFDAIQKYTCDTRYGGYYENMDNDWSIACDENGGDRKSLDIHMHLLEAFTTLAEITKEEIHRRRLKEVLDLIMDHMVNHEHGYGYSQFDTAFQLVPSKSIPRTWNAERGSMPAKALPEHITSYGHNVELSWLANHAISVLGIDSEAYQPTLTKLLDHSLKHGYDYERGGVYRDGIGDEGVLVTDKEWWQNFEALVGFSNGYLLTGDNAYLGAFQGTWGFIQQYFLDPHLGESKELLDKNGDVKIGNLGNPWKGIYHTGRALAQSIQRIETIMEQDRVSGG